MYSELPDKLTLGIYLFIPVCRQLREHSLFSCRFDIIKDLQILLLTVVNPKLSFTTIIILPSTRDYSAVRWSLICPPVYHIDLVNITLFSHASQSDTTLLIIQYITSYFTLHYFTLHSRSLNYISLYISLACFTPKSNCNDCL